MDIRKVLSQKLIDKHLEDGQCKLCPKGKRGHIKHQKNFYDHCQVFHQREFESESEAVRAEAEKSQPRLHLVSTSKGAGVVDNLVMTRGPSEQGC